MRDHAEELRRRSAVLTQAATDASRLVPAGLAFVIEAASLYSSDALPEDVRNGPWSHWLEFVTELSAPSQPTERAFAALRDVDPGTRAESLEQADGFAPPAAMARLAAQLEREGRLPRWGRLAAQLARVDDELARAWVQKLVEQRAADLDRALVAAAAGTVAVHRQQGHLPPAWREIWSTLEADEPWDADASSWFDARLRLCEFEDGERALASIDEALAETGGEGLGGGLVAAVRRVLATLGAGALAALLESESDVARLRLGLAIGTASAFSDATLAHFVADSADAIARVGLAVPDAWDVALGCVDAAARSGAPAALAPLARVVALPRWAVFVSSSSSARWRNLRRDEWDASFFASACELLCDRGGAELPAPGGLAPDWAALPPQVLERLWTMKVAPDPRVPPWSPWPELEP